MLPQQPVPTANLAQVEQQLHLLSLNQHAQHPSLTSAHLHSLLQQAQKHAATRGGAEGTEAANLDESEEAERQKAGEEIIKRVEMRIMEHEKMEMMRKKKAMKIASMVRLFQIF
jgi:DNA topoisomerase 2-associated protein PAT1